MEKIPEKSYGILECLVVSFIFSIPAFFMALFKVNHFIFLLYFYTCCFIIAGYAVHISSHDVSNQINGLLNKAKATRKDIKKYEKNNEI